MTWVTYPKSVLLVSNAVASLSTGIYNISQMTTWQMSAVIWLTGRRYLWSRLPYYSELLSACRAADADGVNMSLAIDGCTMMFEFAIFSSDGLTLTSCSPLLESLEPCLVLRSGRPSSRREAAWHCCMRILYAASASALAFTYNSVLWLTLLLGSS